MKLTPTMLLALRSVAEGDPYGTHLLHEQAMAQRRRLSQANVIATHRALLHRGLLVGHEEVDRACRFTVFTLTDAGRAALAQVQP